MAATPTQLKSLKKVLTFDHPPLCSGAVSPPPEGFHLWYGEKNPRSINFASATPEDLELLTTACDPATFGRGNEEVYDESYRKALKMEASNLAVHLDLVGSDLIRTVEDQLLHGETENKRIKAELHKLNVYEEGSFFNTHKDTPRGVDMLGSLVIIYPTRHEGGELVLRHKDREWKFDAKSLTASRSSPSLAYVAFYSDIDHEVLKVTSGRRVTITYNLYQVNAAPDPGASTVTVNPACPSSFQTTLQGLLKNPSFLPEGGTLGFGLVHLYPVNAQMELHDLVSFLKGEDANVYKICRDLGLESSLRMIHEDTYEPSYGIMLDEIVVDPYYHFETGSYEGALLDGWYGVAVNTREADIDDYYRVSKGETMGEFINWVSPFNTRNRLRDVGINFGNDVSARDRR